MKVYIIMESGWEHNEIMSVHATKMSAEQEMKKNYSKPDGMDYSIDEHEVVE